MAYPPTILGPQTIHDETCHELQDGEISKYTVQQISKYIVQQEQRKTYIWTI